MGPVFTSFPDRPLFFPLFTEVPGEGILGSSAILAAFSTMGARLLREQAVMQANRRKAQTDPMVSPSERVSPSELRQQTKWWERTLERFASTPVGAWYFVHLAPTIDRRLVRRSRGRLSTAIVRPVALLTTTGAKSGQPHTTPVLYFHDDDNVVVLASNGGRPFNPAWYHNLQANPEATLFINGRTVTFTAREATGSERERLWPEAVELYRGYEAYQRRTGGRQIPVMVLTPKGEQTA